MNTKYLFFCLFFKKRPKFLDGKVDEGGSIIFCNISICVEESIHMKDHIPVRSESPSFCIDCP